MKYALTLALSHNAELLIMDEPTSGLDPLTENIRQLFLNIIETAFGFTGVTRHAARVQSYLPDAITERPTIEDIMLANLGGCGK